jgi:peptidoglycan/xylan/chitin deacetylase (PgdA/CDA1 family)
MYHEVVGRQQEVGDFWSVTAETFARQLDWIRAQGYRVVTMEEAVQRPHPLQVAVTFDDGYIGQYCQAFRILAERGMRATFFVTTDWVGTPGFVTWDGLREMKAAGMSIQSHTVTHRFLSTLDRDEVLQELVRSKEEIDDRLGQRTTSLSLPGGDCSRGSIEALARRAGYRFLASSEPGTNAPRYRQDPAWIARLTVRRGQPDGWFERQVRQDPSLLWRARARYRALDLARTFIGRERYHVWRQQLEVRIPALVRRLGA